jgi:microcystin degradation protein MlrC
MLAGGVRSGGISTVKDTEVANQMEAAGQGATLKVLLGAKTDSLHGQPIEVEGLVAGIYRQPIPTDTWSGKLYDVGLIGVLDVQGILVVVTENKIITENIDIFETLGFDVTTMQAVGLKGLGLHIRQAFEGKIHAFVPVDGVGVTHPDVRKLGPYDHVRRPIWPLDDIPSEAYPNW